MHKERQTTGSYKDPRPIMSEPQGAPRPGMAAVAPGDLGLENTSGREGNKMGWSHSSPAQFGGLKVSEICGTQVQSLVGSPQQCRIPQPFCCSWLSVAPGLSAGEVAELPTRSLSCPACQHRAGLILPSWPLGSMFKSPRKLAPGGFPNKGSSAPPATAAHGCEIIPKDFLGLNLGIFWLGKALLYCSAELC